VCRAAVSKSCVGGDPPHPPLRAWGVTPHTPPHGLPQPSSHGISYGPSSQGCTTRGLAATSRQNRKAFGDNNGCCFCCCCLGSQPGMLARQRRPCCCCCSLCQAKPSAIEILALYQRVLPRYCCPSQHVVSGGCMSSDMHALAPRTRPRKANLGSRIVPLQCFAGSQCASHRKTCDISGIRWSVSIGTLGGALDSFSLIACMRVNALAVQGP